MIDMGGFPSLGDDSGMGSVSDRRRERVQADKGDFQNRHVNQRQMIWHFPVQRPSERVKV